MRGGYGEGRIWRGARDMLFESGVWLDLSDSCWDKMMMSEIYVLEVAIFW